MFWRCCTRLREALWRVKRQARSAYWMRHGYALLREQRYEEALAAFTRALACQAGCAPAWRSIAFIQAHLHRPLEALTAAEKALALDPTDPLAYQSKSRALCESGRYTEALDAYAEAQRLAPETIPALWEEVF